MIRFYARWAALGLLTLVIVEIVWVLNVPHEEIGSYRYPTIILLCGSGITFVYCLHKELWEKFFATIYISADEVIWRCPFRKTRRLATRNCYIGVELEDAFNKSIDYPYIYFSLTPYPRDLEHKINKIPCSERFVKYRYHADICEYILKTLPEEQTKRLDYFHYTYTVKGKKKY